MPVLDIDIKGLDIEVLTDGVIFNNKLKLLRPKACPPSEWMEFWERCDIHHGQVQTVVQDGLHLVNLDDL
jgi:beta-xylosidase